ncbi:hypothetical protein [Mucilaginibacter psychrotolerans]|uniref:Uncharacterized protein n=1 Tax=Mucilaginibacter psychrotolerans TaxID=1524096 RepID=A0A4Y8SFM3_9SPHI|nr:hypothetical protein [Mucilaginibacter psychrotolerans]TFF37450.1 hypothetical protein E2R66_11625 [Mucilaginibacter psychrotolerans]
MQNKDFDELFRNKLGDLEVEPGKDLWDNIAAEVVIDSKNRSALPFISIAASVLVLVAAGLFFIPKIKPATIQPSKLIAVNHTGIQKTNTVVPKAAEIKVTAPQAQQVAVVSLPVKQHSVKQSIKKQKSNLPALNTDAIAQQQQPQQIAQQTTHNDVILAAVKSDALAQAAITPTVNAEVKDTRIAALAVPALTAQTLAVVQPKKRRIRSFGDLINVVVAKVDKRKDKLIEFSNKDDDESLITGINLGIIRVKKEEVIATNK